MEKLLKCQKELLLNRWYDVKTDSLMYECRPGNGKRNIVAVACDDFTVENVAHNTDLVALNSFKIQCCINCKECKQVYRNSGNNNHSSQHHLYLEVLYLVVPRYRFMEVIK